MLTNKPRKLEQPGKPPLDCRAVRCAYFLPELSLDEASTDDTGRWAARSTASRSLLLSIAITSV